MNGLQYAARATSIAALRFCMRACNATLRPMGFRISKVKKDEITKTPVQLTRDHVSPDAVLCPNRLALIDLLPKHGVVAEVGVATGDFSRELIKVLSPNRFVAIDTFEWHKLSVLWGQPTSKIFDGLTHEDYYRARFCEELDRGVLTLSKGFSWDCLSSFPDRYFDVIYIDGAHDYESVQKDLNVAKNKIKKDGSIVLNDYTLFDVFHRQSYGVVQACNEFCVTEGYSIAAFALEQLMFCDVLIRRNPIHD